MSSFPSIYEAVSNISSLSYMMPSVLYSGKTTGSIPGSPSFSPWIISAMLLQFARTYFLVYSRGIL